LNHHFVTAVKLDIYLFLVYGSTWFVGIECFPTVLICRIQISNHFLFWLSGTSSNIKLYVFWLLEPSICHCSKVGYQFVSCVCEHMNCWNTVFSNCFDVMNPNIKSFFILVEWDIIKQKIVSVLVTWTIIFHCSKVGYQFVSCVCEHMNYWNTVFSNCFDMLNPNMKSFFIFG